MELSNRAGRSSPDAMTAANVIRSLTAGPVCSSGLFCMRRRLRLAEGVGRGTPACAAAEMAPVIGTSPCPGQSRRLRMQNNDDLAHHALEIVLNPSGQAPSACHDSSARR